MSLTYLSLTFWKGKYYFFNNFIFAMRWQIFHWINVEVIFILSSFPTIFPPYTISLFHQNSTLQMHTKIKWFLVHVFYGPFTKHLCILFGWKVGFPKSNFYKNTQFFQIGFRTRVSKVKIVILDSAFLGSPQHPASWSFPACLQC